MKACIMHEQIMCHLRLFVNMNVYLFIYSVVHSILPRPCSARERFFSPTFWKGGRSEKSECLVILKEFLPQMFPWGNSFFNQWRTGLESTEMTIQQTCQISGIFWIFGEANLQHWIYFSFLHVSLMFLEKSEIIFPLSRMKQV